MRKYVLLGIFLITVIISVSCSNAADTNIPVSKITVNITKSTLTVGNTLQLDATIEPTNATDKNVEWSSGDSTIATVSSAGLVTGIKAGTTMINVLTNDTLKKATCEVTVNTVLTATIYELGIDGIWYFQGTGIVPSGASPTWFNSTDWLDSRYIFNASLMTFSIYHHPNTENVSNWTTDALWTDNTISSIEKSMIDTSKISILHSVLTAKDDNNQKTLGSDSSIYIYPISSEELHLWWNDQLGKTSGSYITFKRTRP